jgi:hypothetical protein
VITFPSNPEIGDEYSAENDVIYTWQGNRWVSQTSSSRIPSLIGNAGQFLSNNGSELIWDQAGGIERFKINYAANGQISTISDSTGGIASVTIVNATAGEISISFSGYQFPPGAIISYGYDYTNNKYYIVPLETSVSIREVPGGGVSGSPTAFTAGFSAIKLRLREAETGASRGTFGTTTHAWIQCIMSD